MNLNNMLLVNVRTSDYFKVLCDVTEFSGVVDQIFYDVKSALPWVPGTHNVAGTSGMCGAVRGVSAAGRCTSCFCLLFKCFTLKLTPTQINHLITHTDSPYIRVVGFLYLRYCCKPSLLFGWFERYLGDTEEFHVKGEKYGESDRTTIGAWLRHLLTDMDYHETMLPRIPIPVQKDIKQKLSDWDAAHPEARQYDAGAHKVALREDHKLFQPLREGASDRGRERDRDRGRDRDRDRGREPAEGNAYTAKRIDPADGNAYTREEFMEAYGGTGEWDAAAPIGGGGGGGGGGSAYGGSGGFAPGRDRGDRDDGGGGDRKRQKVGRGPPPKEKRIDPADGNEYTKADFIEQYGGTREWEAAGKR